MLGHSISLGSPIFDKSSKGLGSICWVIFWFITMELSICWWMLKLGGRPCKRGNGREVSIGDGKPGRFFPSNRFSASTIFETINSSKLRKIGMIEKSRSLANSFTHSSSFGRIVSTKRTFNFGSAMVQDANKGSLRYICKTSPTVGVNKSARRAEVFCISGMGLSRGGAGERVGGTSWITDASRSCWWSSGSSLNSLGGPEHLGFDVVPMFSLLDSGVSDLSKLEKFLLVQSAEIANYCNTSVICELTEHYVQDITIVQSCLVHYFDVVDRNKLEMGCLKERRSRKDKYCERIDGWKNSKLGDVSEPLLDTTDKKRLKKLSLSLDSNTVLANRNQSSIMRKSVRQPSNKLFSEICQRRQKIR